MKHCISWCTLYTQSAAYVKSCNNSNIILTIKICLYYEIGTPDYFVFGKADHNV